MMCPYCGKQMKNGYIQSAREIFWSTQKKKLFFKAMGREDKPLASFGWNGSSAIAFYCDNCRKVVIDCKN